MVNGQGEAVIVSVAVFLGIAFLTCCLRGYVRFRITRVPGCDDYLMLTGMFFNIGLAICSILGAKEGIGRKLSYFEHRPLHFRHALLCFWLAQLFYSVTSVLVRLSIIITLLRLAVDKLQRRILYAVSTASLIAGLIFFFFTIFFCNPVVNHWERVRTHGKCKDVNYLLGVGYMYSGIAAVCDFTLGVLPIFMIGKLQMDWKFKMGVIALLSIGCLAGTAVVVRIPFLQMTTSDDFLYRSVQVSIWSNIETSLGIIGGSLMTVRPILRAIRWGSPG